MPSSNHPATSQRIKAAPPARCFDDARQGPRKGRAPRREEAVIDHSRVLSLRSQIEDAWARVRESNERRLTADEGITSKDAKAADHELDPTADIVLNGFTAR